MAAAANFKNQTRPKVVFSGQTVAHRSIYCIKVEREVVYNEFVYAVSDIFVLPVFAYTLVGRHLSAFCNLFCQISHLYNCLGSVWRYTPLAYAISGFAETASSCSRLKGGR